jgi:hypothetical protein
MPKGATKVKFKAKLFRPAEKGAWLFLRLPKEASRKLPTRDTVS